MASFLQQFTFGIKYVKRAENLSDSLFKVEISHLENKSLDNSFTQAIIDEKDIELYVIDVYTAFLNSLRTLF